MTKSWLGLKGLHLEEDLAAVGGMDHEVTRIPIGLARLQDDTVPGDERLSGETRLQQPMLETNLGKVRSQALAQLADAGHPSVDERLKTCPQRDHVDEGSGQPHRRPEPRQVADPLVRSWRCRLREPTLPEELLEVSGNPWPERLTGGDIWHGVKLSEPHVPVEAPPAVAYVGPHATHASRMGSTPNSPRLTRREVGGFELRPVSWRASAGTLKTVARPARGLRWRAGGHHRVTAGWLLRRGLGCRRGR